MEKPKLVGNLNTKMTIRKNQILGLYRTHTLYFAFYFQKMPIIFVEDNLAFLVQFESTSCLISICRQEVYDRTRSKALAGNFNDEFWVYFWLSHYLL